MLGYFTVSSVRDLLLQRESFCLPHGHELYILSVNFLVDVTGWAEMGCKNWGTVYRLRFWFEGCVCHCVFQQVWWTPFLEGRWTLEGTGIHLTSFSKYFSKLQNLRCVCWGQTTISDGMGGCDQIRNRIFSLKFSAFFPLTDQQSMLMCWVQRAELGPTLLHSVSLCRWEAALVAMILLARN